MILLDDALIAAWDGDDTFAEIGRKLGMSRSGVRRAFDRLMRHGRISEEFRPRRLAKTSDITEFRDPLLKKLKEVHGSP